MSTNTSLVIVEKLLVAATFYVQGSPDLAAQYCLEIMRELLPTLSKESRVYILAECIRLQRKQDER